MDPSEYQNHIQPEFSGYINLDIQITSVCLMHYNGVSNLLFCNKYLYKIILYMTVHLDKHRFKLHGDTSFRLTKLLLSIIATHPNVLH